MIYRLIRKQYLNFAGVIIKKWYAQAVTIGRATLDDMGESISGRTTVTIVDIRAVIFALKQEIKERLRRGEIVDLEELGAFHLAIENKDGAETKESWKPSMIARAVVRWISNKKMRQIAEGVEFHPWINLEEKNMLQAAAQARDAIVTAEHKVAVAKTAVEMLEKEVKVFPNDPLKPVMLNAAKAQLEVAEATLVSVQAAYAEKTANVKQYEAVLKRKLGEPHEDDLTDLHLPESTENNNEEQ